VGTAEVTVPSDSRPDVDGPVAPSADLVVWSRLGSTHSRQELRDAVDEQTLIELRGSLRPAGDLALYRADMAEWPGTGELHGWQQYQRDWVLANNACRRDILERLRADGPLPARELPETCVKAPVLDRLEQQQEPHHDAGLSGAARGGRGRRWVGTGPAVGPCVPGLPGPTGGPVGGGTTAAVDREIRELARWLDLELVLPD
jgi:hypothetical protein